MTRDIRAIRDPWELGYKVGIAEANGELEYSDHSPFPSGSSEDALWSIGRANAWEDEYPEVFECET